MAPAHPRYGLWHKQGTGKTASILFNEKRDPRKTLVVCPLSVIDTAWARDSKALGVPFRRIAARTKTARMRILSEVSDAGPGVYAINFEQFRTAADELARCGFERLVVDESSRIKNRDAKVTKAVIRFADRMESVYLLSGTPAPNSPTEYWAQLRAISPKAPNGNFFAWAYRWFYPISMPIKGRNVVTDWRLKPDRVDAFRAHLSEWCWFLSKAECVDLPEQTDQIIEVVLSPAEKRMYSAALGELDADELREIVREGRPLPVHALAQLTMARQITGGAVRDKDSDYEEFGSSKLDALMEVVGELDSPFIVWAEYRHEIQRIVGAMTRAGIHVQALYGETSKNAGYIVDAFRKGGRTGRRCLVAHPQTAGHGINGLQEAASYAIYYSLSWSAELHEQSRDRLHRNGQTEPVNYIYLIAKDTLDEGLLETVRDKEADATTILESLKL